VPALRSDPVAPVRALPGPAGRARSVLGVALVVAAAVAAAAAGPSGTALTDVGGALAAARAALDRRAWPEVVAALDRGLRFARAEAPLVLSEVRLVRDAHAGLGAWTTLPTTLPTTGKDGAALVEGRTLRLYVEVDNVVAAPQPDGRQRLALAVRGRFALLADDSSREELGDKDLGRQELSVWRTTGVHSFGVDVALSDKAPPGRYAVTVMVTDEVGHKTAERSLAFVLR